VYLHCNIFLPLVASWAVQDIRDWSRGLPVLTASADAHKFVCKLCGKKFGV